MPCAAKSSFKTGFTDLSLEINHINSVLPKTGFSRVKSEIRKSLLSEFELSTAPQTNLYSIHRKKRFTSFPSPAGMSLTKLPLGRNNSVMTSLFPPRESLVVHGIPAGDVKLANLFLRCTVYCTVYTCC
jgi:hypothetical protein